MTAGVDEDGRPETPTWTYACVLKDLLLLFSLQVVAAVHSPDRLPEHHLIFQLMIPAQLSSWKEKDIMKSWIEWMQL